MSSLVTDTDLPVSESLPTPPLEKSGNLELASSPSLPEMNSQGRKTYFYHENKENSSWYPSAQEIEQLVRASFSSSFLPSPALTPSSADPILRINPS
jgi:hypothetical protein